MFAIQCHGLVPIAKLGVRYQTRTDIRGFTVRCPNRWTNPTINQTYIAKLSIDLSYRIPQRTKSLIWASVAFLANSSTSTSTSNQISSCSASNVSFKLIMGRVYINFENLSRTILKDRTLNYWNVSSKLRTISKSALRSRTLLVQLQ